MSAQAGHGFARVENAGLGPAHGFDKLAREGGDAAHALQEVQDHALTGKKDARIVPDDGDRLVLVQAHAIENFRMAGHLIVRDDGTVERGEHVEDGWNHAHAGEHAILLGEHDAGGSLIGLDAGIAGRIARGPVFEQRVLDNGCDTAAVPIQGSGLR